MPQLHLIHSGKKEILLHFFLETLNRNRRNQKIFAVDLFFQKARIFQKSSMPGGDHQQLKKLYPATSFQ